MIYSRHVCHSRPGRVMAAHAGPLGAAGPARGPNPPNPTKDKECDILSDYYRNHNQSSDPFQPPRNGAAEDAAPWDMPMDGPEMAQGMPAWQQPGVMGSGFLAEDPAPFGAEMQQSGVPLFQDAMDFRTQGDDAPTRVAKPLAQQMVNKRTTVGRGPGPFERPAAPVAQPADAAPAPAGASARPPGRPGSARTPPRSPARQGR